MGCFPSASQVEVFTCLVVSPIRDDGVEGPMRTLVADDTELR